MNSLDRFASAKLAKLETQSLRREITCTDRGGFPVVEQGGRHLISFSCNDYLGLSSDTRVKEAAIAALAQFGVGGGASRLVTGNHPAYRPLEQKLAALKAADACCVFGSGYLANIGVIGALVGPGDLVLLDALAHACLHAGAALSKAEVVLFSHNDVEELDRVLNQRRSRYRYALVATETVFSMDGDRAPLRALAELAERHDAWLVSDDAHGFGVGVEHVPVPLMTGTLSKAVGGYGGYCCGSAEVIALLKTRARSLIYSTALPPATVAGALAALHIMEHEPERMKRPLANARLFTQLLALPPAESAIVPLVVGSPDAALSASAALADAGFLVTAIRPPTVPDGTARLRFAFSAVHTEPDVRRLAEAVKMLPVFATKSPVRAARG